MSLEGPAISAVMARLAYPEINMAAYSGVVFPLALIIESPIIMLLAASTALSKDWASYRLIRRFMMTAGALLTLLHILIAFTPLYYFVVEDIMGAKPQIVEPARIGLMIMLPWTWSIAYRRFNQGVLIRTGHSRSVGLGTVVRLSANLLVLAIGYSVGSIPGIVVGSSAVACGVMSEAAYIRLIIHPVLNRDIKPAPAVDPPLTWAAFWAFYTPLVLTSLLSLLANPIGSAAMNRMPLAIESLAVWLVVSGLIFMLRSLGIAYNEVVVSFLDRNGSYKSLNRFASVLILSSTAGLFLITATPLSRFWFQEIFALRPELSIMGQRALWIALPLPALTVLQSWYQGAILHDGRTRAITKSVLIYLLTSLIVLGFGVAFTQVPGLYFGVLALTLSVATQTIWLWLRSRSVLRDLKLGQIQESTPSLEAAA